MLGKINKPADNHQPKGLLSIAEELEKLAMLKNDNIISEEEYQKLKDKLLNS